MVTGSSLTHHSIRHAESESVESEERLGTRRPIGICSSLLVVHNIASSAAGPRATLDAGTGHPRGAQRHRAGPSCG